MLIMRCELPHSQKGAPHERGRWAMPFVKRDTAGRVVALYREQGPEAPEYLASNHPEVAEFADTEANASERVSLVQSDLEMIRVYEDLIDILISKRIVVLTDFPPRAQEKLVRRKRLRSSLGALTEVLAPEDDDEGEDGMP